MWNFGDATEESAALATGDRLKVASLSKKVERLWLKDASKIENTGPFLPFLGQVSRMKASQGLRVCEIFCLPFYLNAPPSVTPSSSTIIPAWLVGTTNKAKNATVLEVAEKLNAVL